MKKQLNDKNYIAIADWMLELGLNTRELLTYAIIYGFCQDGEGYYYGSYSYLANWLGMDDINHVERYLKKLVQEKLVIKKEGRSKLNQKVCLYKTINNKGTVINNPDVDYIIIQPWMLQQMHLNGKDLLLYALVHGYSRKESDNVCFYKRDYFAKWLQCQKNNVRRQVDRAVENGLIKEISKKTYIAIVPENNHSDLNGFDDIKLDDIDLDNIDNTFSNKKSQNGSTPTGKSLKMGVPQPKSISASENDSLKMGVPRSQTGSGKSLKMGDNNLVNNLVDNLNSIYNNNSNINTLVTDSKTDKSVVDKQNDFLSFDDFYYKVNIDLISPNMESKEYTALIYKTDIDYELYQKYVNSSIDVIQIIRKLSVYLFRIILVSWPIPDKTTKDIEDLILYVLTCKKFRNRTDVINSISSDQIFELFTAALELYDEDNPKMIQKSKKAYLIGVLENILNN